MIFYLATLLLFPPPDVAPAPVAIRAATAPVIVVGTITEHVATPVDVETAPGTKKFVPFRLITIRVDSAIVGTESDTHIKVGLQDAPGAAWAVGEAGCFFLQPHSVGAFRIPVPGLPNLSSKSVTYSQDLETVKRTMEVLADPEKSLKATAAVERYFAAAVLLARYSTTPPNAAKTEMVPVSLAESQLLFAAIAEADWTKPPAGLPEGLVLVAQLGLVPADLWKPKPHSGPGNVALATQQQFKTWLAGPGAKAQVKRIVVRK